MTIAEETIGSEHQDVALLLNFLAIVYSRQGNYVQAEPLYQRACTIYEKVLGPEHPDTAASLTNLAAY